MRVINLFAAGLAALSLAACAAPNKPDGMAVQAPPPAAPVKAKAEIQTFQAALDRHGVPLKAPKKGKAIIVNIPSYELIALEDGEEAFRLRVIVGAPWGGRKTPVMDTYASVARFLPTWRPTPSMLRTGAYTDGVRGPGRSNPLGLVALRLEPGMLVYLHDTNKPQLFDKDKRALSWGCVRVDDVEKLITWALDMAPEQYADLISGRRTTDVPAYDMMPVMLRYYTSFPDAAGELRHHDDIYGRGQTVLLPRRTTTVAAKG